MRTIHQLKHIQRCLYELRVSQGKYLKDVAYDELRKEEIAELMKEAEHLHFKTELVLRKVRRNKKWVWRFMNRNGL